MEVSEVIAAIILILWALGAAVLYAVLVVMIKQENSSLQIPSPFSLLLLIIAVAVWPVTVTPLVYEMKKRGEI